MKKPFTLKKHLIVRTPWLKVDPDHLVMIATTGQIAATGVGGSFSYEQQYTLEVTFLDFDHDPEEVIVPIFEWLQTNQPDLLDNPDWQQNGITFDLVVIDEAKVDLTIRLKLTERIIAELIDETESSTRKRFKIDTADEPQRPDLMNLPEGKHPER